MTTAPASHGRPAATPIAGPLVIAVRGPSRSGKTAMCERLIRAGTARGLKVAWLKRTHHEIDHPEKASGRIWSAGPAASALRSTDRLQVTVPAPDPTAVALLASLPSDIDLVLLETHEPEAYPTILSSAVEPFAGEEVVGRWDCRSEEAAALSVFPELLKRLPADRELDMAFRAALRLHGGNHGCAGLVLGTRLALAGAAALGISVPDREKRLIVAAESDRCAVDGIQAVTGCRPGKRTLRLLDYGKLAATFFDEHAGRAVRVAARGDLRERVGATGDGRHEVQRQAYATWAPADLFTVQDVPFAISQYDRPGPPRNRVICAGCGEEVSDGRHRETESGPRCQPCMAEPKHPRGVLPHG